MKRWVPAALTVAGLVGLGGLALWRVLGITVVGQRAATGAVLVIYVTWMLWESRVSVREISSGPAPGDRGTLELCAAVKIALLIAVLAVPAPPVDGWRIVVRGGAALMLLSVGVALRVWAIRTLGTTYTHRIRDPGTLVERGPYRWMRHPAYAGTLLIHAGVVGANPNGFALTALIAWVAAVALRTRVEDRWLMRSEAYRRYRLAVPGGWFPRARGGGLQSRMALLYSGAFVAAIAVLTWRKLQTAPASHAVTVAAAVILYLLWMIVESKTAVSEWPRARTAMDRGTMELYAFGRAATVLTALGLPTSSSLSPAWSAIALLVCASGIVLRLSAIRALGTAYSYRVRVEPEQPLISSGPYRVVRHPAYAGMLLAHLGFVAVLYNPVSLVMLAAWFLPALLLRIRVEEAALEGLPGYTDYARAKKRLIPLVW